MDTTKTGVIIRDGVVYGGGASRAADVTYDKSGAKTSVQSELDTLNENLGGFMFRVNEDGTEQKSIDGGETWTNFSKGAVKELLWVNPSPTSGFDAQTISLNLAEYEEFIIEFFATTRTDISYGKNIVTRVYAKKDDDFSYFGGGTYLSTGPSVRNFSINDNGITFELAYVNGGYTYNNWIIPTKIYGLKEGVPSALTTVKEQIFLKGDGNSFQFASMNDSNFVTHGARVGSVTNSVGNLFYYYTHYAGQTTPSTGASANILAIYANANGKYSVNGVMKEYLKDELIIDMNIKSSIYGLVCAY